MITQDELTVETLGRCRFDSPRLRMGAGFISDEERIRWNNRAGEDDYTLERAGPRERIYFEPATTTAAFVTCGGLSPGLNNVIRSGVLELVHNYGVTRILGIPDGYQGLTPDSRSGEPVELTPASVRHIHEFGGTVLSSSRGPQDPGVMADMLERFGIDILFCVGGDGTQRGAARLEEELRRRGRPVAVVGIPKSIDNDVPGVWSTFGYATALERAQDVLRAAHTEAVGAPNGIGLVKLMGRDAGFIAAGAAVASQDANFVLVPEVEFPLDGEPGLLASLERRLRDRGHALIVAAEGAGQHLFHRRSEATDASGNSRHRDIGVFLKEEIERYFGDRDVGINLKYIDPSYVIRSAPANSWDRMLSDRMARCAVHAAMAGKTAALIGWWNQELVHVPFRAATAERKRMDIHGDLWRAVISATGQPWW